MNSLKGIFPALLTPFSIDGNINERSLRELLRMNLEKGADGFYVGGSTSEAFLMSMEERKRVMDIVCDEVSDRCAVIAHIGCIGTAQAIEMAKYAKSLGMDAMSSVPPFYYHFSFEQICQYYFDIVNAVDLPMVIYNFPDFSGVVLNSDNIDVFLRDPRFIGIKHTSSDFYSMERFRKARRDLLIYNGYDEMFMSGLAAGADGAIGSTFNVMAEKFVKIMSLFKKGMHTEAMAEQERANNIIQALVRVGVFAGEKAILTHLGIDFGVPRKPFTPLSEKECNDLIRVYEENR
ncbi:MAG: N-acetylneuraminate lyase [Clostridiales bacterium]|jgi:N-acetylneuraminate lyase|nr:N-acetylneuraminate lyase [Clostridiales bacterium]